MASQKDLAILNAVDAIVTDIGAEPVPTGFSGHTLPASIGVTSFNSAYSTHSLQSSIIYATNTPMQLATTTSVSTGPTATSQSTSTITTNPPSLVSATASSPSSSSSSSSGTSISTGVIVAAVVVPVVVIAILVGLGIWLCRRRRGRQAKRIDDSKQSSLDSTAPFGTTRPGEPLEKPLPNRPPLSQPSVTQSLNAPVGVATAGATAGGMAAAAAAAPRTNSSKAAPSLRPAPKPRTLANGRQFNPPSSFYSESSTPPSIGTAVTTTMARPVEPVAPTSHPQPDLAMLNRELPPSPLTAANLSQYQNTSQQTSMIANTSQSSPFDDPVGADAGTRTGTGTNTDNDDAISNVSAPTAYGVPDAARSLTDHPLPRPDPHRLPSLQVEGGYPLSPPTAGEELEPMSPVSDMSDENPHMVDFPHSHMPPR